jgi:hypothetical protein
MPLLTSFKVKKSLKAIPRFVPMALEEAFLVGPYVFDSRPRLQLFSSLLEDFSSTKRRVVTRNDTKNKL